ncbi:MAG: hypothetical protein ACXVFN_11785 [Solirubrobacteraceae bacterium]
MAASLAACPICDLPLESAASARETLGFRLHDAAEPLPELPAVIAASLAVPPSEAR